MTPEEIMQILLEVEQHPNADKCTVTLMPVVTEVKPTVTVEEVKNVVED